MLQTRGKGSWQIGGLVLSGLLFLLTSSCIHIYKERTICDIQGVQPKTSYQGSYVRVDGEISAQLSDRKSPGVFLQDDCSVYASSFGIRVMLDEYQEWLKPGDHIRVKGIVGEHEGETILITTLDQIRILSAGINIPEALDLSSLFFLDPFNFSYEYWEGVHVELSNGLILTNGMNDQDMIICPLFFEHEEDLGYCPLGLPFHLRIRGSLVHPGLDVLQVGDHIKNVSGILRQDRSGYYIYVIDPSGIGINKVTVANNEIMVNTLTADKNKDVVEPLTATIQEQTSTIVSTISPMPTVSTTATQRPSPTWYPIPLLISEVFPDPAGKEPDLEWIEIYNPNLYGIPLTGIKLGDAVTPAGKEGMLKFPEGWFIESREVLVIANQGTAFRDWYGFYPDFELYDSTTKVPELLPYPEWAGSTITLRNSGDEVLLIDPWEGIIDQVAYGSSSWSGFTPPVEAPGEGISLERFPPDRDQDTKDDWRLYPGGSPGELAQALPTSSPEHTMTLSPSMFPSFTSTCTATLTPLSTLGPTFTPVHSNTPFPFPTKTMITSPSPSNTYSSPTVFTGTPSPTNSVTTLTSSPEPFLTITSSPSATVQPSPTPTYPTSTPHLITPTKSATTLPSWTPPYQTVTPSPIPTITPSSFPTMTPIPTPTIPQTTWIRINEIHADPHPELGDANMDGEVHSDDDEFIEIVNAGSGHFDLSGWKILDRVKTRFIFPDDVILNSGCGLVIFGGHVDLTEISGSRILSGSSLGLNNSGDTIYLLDQIENVYLSHTYGPEGGQDQSLTRFPDIEGGLPFLLHSEVLEAGGSLFSPGTKVDGRSFSECP